MSMIIDCPSCRAKVAGEVVATVEVMPRFDKGDELEEVIADPARTAWPARVLLLQCPSCREAIVVRQLRKVFEEGWTEPYRVWPDPERPPYEPVPESVRASLTEARRCLSCGAFTASVAMSGRALEAIARHFHAGPDGEHVMLGQGLTELHAKKVIDDRLYNWGKQLQKHRNLAAHATGTSFVRRDAQDLLDFALAICDYVFVLEAKYEAFIERNKDDAQSPEP